MPFSVMTPLPIIDSRRRVEATGCLLSEVRHLAASRLPSAVGGPVCRQEDAHNHAVHMCRNTKQKVSEWQWRPAGPTTHTAIIMMEEYGRNCAQHAPFWWILVALMALSSSTSLEEQNIKSSIKFQPCLTTLIRTHLPPLRATYSQHTLVLWST